MAVLGKWHFKSSTNCYSLCQKRVFLRITAVILILQKPMDLNQQQHTESNINKAKTKNRSGFARLYFPYLFIKAAFDVSKSFHVENAILRIELRRRRISSSPHFFSISISISIAKCVCVCMCVFCVCVLCNSTVFPQNEHITNIHSFKRK